MFKLLIQLIASFLQKLGIMKTKTTDKDVKEFMEAHAQEKTQEP